MSNHYHLVLRIDEKRAKDWTAEEVINRWYQIFNGTVRVDRALGGETKSKAEIAAVKKLVKEWRSWLCDLGWLMRCMNEAIARQANAEDNG